MQILSLKNNKLTPDKVSQLLMIEHTEDTFLKY